MKIFAFTWNTHGHFSIPDIPSNSDLVLVSLQECFSISNLKDLLNRFNFVKVTSMFGLKTIVLSKKNITMESCKIGQGIFGFVNKGFIATKIYWGNHRILHVNAHLSAHTENRKRRKEQLEEILSYVNEQSVNTVILAGDLNFRNEINDLCNDSKSKLGDLCNVRNQNNDLYRDVEGEEFKNEYKIFKEAPLNFKPSYKFDGSVYNKNRTPSYCDRVIVGSSNRVDFMEYRSMDEITDSDHKPVFCRFEIIGNNQENIKFEKWAKKRNFIVKKAWTRIMLFFLERKMRILMILAIFSGMMIKMTADKIPTKNNSSQIKN